MRSVTVTFVVALTFQAYAKELVTNHTRDAQDSMQKLVNHLVDNLFNRALNNPGLAGSRPIFWGTGRRDPISHQRAAPYVHFDDGRREMTEADVRVLNDLKEKVPGLLANMPDSAKREAIVRLRISMKREEILRLRREADALASRLQQMMLPKVEEAALRERIQNLRHEADVGEAKILRLKERSGMVTRPGFLGSLMRSAEVAAAGQYRASRVFFDELNRQTDPWATLRDDSAALLRLGSNLTLVEGYLGLRESPRLVQHAVAIYAKAARLERYAPGILAALSQPVSGRDGGIASNERGGSIQPLQWLKKLRSFTPWSRFFPEEAQQQCQQKRQQRVVGERCSKDDLQQASADLSGVIPGDVLATLHSDGSWRYSRMLDQNVKLKCEVDEEGSTKEFTSTLDQLKFVQALGQQLQVVGERCSKEELEHASSDLSSVSVGDVVAIMRSDGSWRRAKLLEQTIELHFQIDAEGRTQELTVDSTSDQVKALPVGKEQRTINSKSESGAPLSYLDMIEPHLDEILERFDDIEPHVPFALKHLEVLAPHIGTLLKHLDALLLYGQDVGTTTKLLDYLPYFVPKLDALAPHLDLIRPHIPKLMPVLPIIAPYADRFAPYVAISANADVLLWYFGWVLHIPGLRHLLLIPGFPRLASFLARNLPRWPVRGRSSEMACDGEDCEVSYVANAKRYWKGFGSTEDVQRSVDAALGRQRGFLGC